MRQPQVASAVEPELCPCGHPILTAHILHGCGQPDCGCRLDYSTEIYASQSEESEL